MSKKTPGVLTAVRHGRGGVKVAHHKNTAEMAIERMPVPKKVILPMQQHIGVPCTPIVKVGDTVAVGQKIGDSDKFISAPIHASVSGTVTVPLVNCQNLIWVELIDCYELTDISPLKNIPSIRYLSVSETEVSDISATDSLPNLERFGAVKRNISADQQERFRALHPDCIAIFDYDENPYGYGWRYNYGSTFEYYQHMREAFHYDDTGFFGNQKGAVYCPIYLKDIEGYPWYEWQN